MLSAGMTTAGRPIQESIARVNHENDGKHFINSPQHATVIVHQLHGDVASFEQRGNDDPLLYAYQLRDSLPRWLGYLKELVEWSNEVIDATPDQLMESGAQSCNIPS